MPRIRNTISGKITSPQTIEVVNSKQSKLIPGQKVLIYRTTDHNIVSASGKIIGKKEQILGSGEVKLVENQLVVTVANNGDDFLFHRIKSKPHKILKKNIKVHATAGSGKHAYVHNSPNVYIKAIEE